MQKPARRSFRQLSSPWTMLKKDFLSMGTFARALAVGLYTPSRAEVCHSFITTTVQEESQVTPQGLHKYGSNWSIKANSLLWGKEENLFYRGKRCCVVFQGPYCKEIVLNCIGAQLNSNMLESGWGHGHGYGPRLGSDRVRCQKYAIICQKYAIICHKYAKNMQIYRLY